MNIEQDAKTATDAQITRPSSAENNPSGDAQTTAPPTPDSATAPVSNRTHLALIHDRNGTWFSVGGLELVALTPEELDELEAGNEHLLDDLPSINLLDVLPAALPEEDSVQWT
ncbi:hypothetical protein [Nostocoides sp. HKS02]|uniref:hypothetical protein n=1 Tax=Nostocoides sp. HKS02 TaxID=1813880 RepID=UPI0012B444CE|nr:hypothetical protein [Tetrasphaera sp. HKS02]QGN58086.1 hypothetical protein GKE56_09500 [Tetrasphaera sp. HKS02]